MSYQPAFAPPTAPPPPPSSYAAPPAPAGHLRRQPASSQAASLPRVGETRCYWALLSSDLRFLFLDPVLAHHLGHQRDPLLGRSLLEFVHPDEQASAENDLAGVLESRTLHGSVTRVRYCRLSKIRKLLGFQGVPDVPPVMEPVFFDASYMACDLVINLASDGLVLCFIHAVIDIAPEDNDEHKRTPWTNWCGTPTGGLTPDLAAFLRLQLEAVIPRPPPDTDPYTRVFQLLENTPDRAVVFSWPPECNQDDYGRLAADIQMQFNQPAPHLQNGGHHHQQHNPTADAKTSCTRRYKAQQWLVFQDGIEREIESIFIPYGCIIFACHKTVTSRRPNQPAGGVQYGFSQQQQQQQPAVYYDQQSGGFPQGGAGFAVDPWSAAAAVGNIGAYIAQQQQQGWAQQPLPTQHLPFPVQEDEQHEASPTHSNASSGSLMHDVPPPPAQRQRTTSAKEEGGGGRASRSSGNPPVGVTKCSNCKIKTSPEWRKGPSGKKDLCNACGLRYARSRAKREGHPVQRRKKEKGEGSAGPSRSKKGSPARTATPVSVAVPVPLKSEQWMEAAAQLASGYNVSTIAQYADMLMQQQQQQQQQHTPSPSPPTPTHNPAGAAYYQQAMYDSQQQRFLQGQGQGHLGLLSSASFERAQELQQGVGPDKLPPTPVSAEQERATADGVYAQ
ncbi:hypothetical protein AURDEDRAFT_182843 [Auricularia subglabra TFB-10046 SS5]|nr:hypothetical protein AURDEDRAFT_182843 [Auricularia subglabra TFB-10046 SS5]